MPQIIYSQKAIDDLSRIRSFLSHKNQLAAINAAKSIVSSINILKDNPIGRQLIYGKQTFYEIVIPFGSTGYVAKYALNDNIIIILGIKHQKECGYKRH